jgi:hypothetical protein
VLRQLRAGIFARPAFDQSFLLSRSILRSGFEVSDERG